MIDEMKNSIDYASSTSKMQEALLFKALSEATVPVAHKGESYKLGVTEDTFYDELVRFFQKYDYSLSVIKNSDGVKIFPKGDFNVSILRQYVLPSNPTKLPFVPDFILSIASTKQNVVIEIDEPYAGISKIPIHYIGSRDEYRDTYFLANGWIVIRFAEEQIVKQPLSCCCFIVDILLQNTPSFEMSSIHYKSGMSSWWDEDGISQFNKIPQWTKNQAGKWANDNYRNTYLPSNIVPSISKEVYIPDGSDDIESRNSLKEPRTVFNREEYEKHDEKHRQLFKVVEDDDNDLPF